MVEAVAITFKGQAMKHEVDELDGPLLDQAVAKILYPDYGWSCHE